MKRSITEKKTMNFDKRIFFPVFTWNVHRLEKRLTKESSEGYRLVSGTGWNMYFKKTDPKERLYIAYCSPFLAKPDRFLDEYICDENAYQLRKSPLKKGSKLFYFIFEVDERKKDRLFHLIYQSRDHFYFKHYTLMLIVNSIFSTIMALLGMIPSNESHGFLILFILSGVFFLKNLFLFLFFCFKMKAYKKA